MEALGRIGERRLTDGPHCVIDGSVYELIDCQARYHADSIDTTCFGDDTPTTVRGLRQLEVTLRVEITAAAKLHETMGINPVPVTVVPRGGRVTSLDFDGMVTMVTAGAYDATVEIVSTGQPRLVLGT